jgi:hypothetical protein
MGEDAVQAQGLEAKSDEGSTGLFSVSLTPESRIELATVLGFISVRMKNEL